MEEKFNKADFTLLFVAMIFLFSLYLEMKLAGTGWAEYARGFHFIADAAFVGGIADWFAVTAIFKHPLGLPIPNTAILPGKRQQFIDGTISLVKNQLLTEKNIVKQIRNFNILGALHEALSQEKNQRKVINYLLDMIKEKLQAIKQSNNVTEFAELFRKQILSISPRKMILSIIKILQKENNGAVFLEKIAPILRQQINSNEFRATMQDSFKSIEESKSSEGLLSSIMIKAGKTLGLVDVEQAANLTHEQMLTMIDEVSIRNSQLQNKALHLIIERAEEIASNYEMLNFIDEFRKKLIDELPLEEMLQDVFEKLQTNFNQETTREKISSMTRQALRSHISDILHDEFKVVLQSLKVNELLQKDLDKFLHKAAGHFAISSASSIIEDIIKTALNNMSEDQINNIVKSKINKDLIFIRMNGSLVGGIIGAVLFILMKFLGDPLINLIMR